MLVVGFSTLFLFAIWKEQLAPIPLFEWRLLPNRAIIGAVLLGANVLAFELLLQILFTSWLKVNNNLTITTANYINNIFHVLSGVSIHYRLGDPQSRQVIRVMGVLNQWLEGFWT
ncbi:hypothetical protein BDW66DRAFT_124762 [Aspergillus desertorum]